ncbi:PIG-L family deacetylase [Arthrobacter sp. Y-9]|uniref:PIG-L deacetylase family protein n=1 Tax=Arthrobacter sp. Y-9 TaxID=3039385 RepID=UPI00242013B0|nr:PIG-L family deacetylase [Arthrobacter sp. Y-9]WFR84304.1 PIG-L family deacetylase [Arthrobacter sp. Y-9]
MSNQTTFERSLEGNAPWLFLSPHLDDAVLSCGALIEAQTRQREITVATLFTEAMPAPHTRAARSFMRQCSVMDAGSLFQARQAEDRAVLKAMGVQSVHLGAVDALFRGRRRPAKLRRGVWDALLPELTHRYPTFRFDIALGRIARGDRELIRHLQGSVAELLHQTNSELLFCPAGVGKHVDHMITRGVGEEYPEKLVMYSDFPYDLASEPDEDHLSEMGLLRFTWGSGLETKSRRIKEYITQVDALFPGGAIPLKPETYFVPGPGNAVYESI